MHEVAFDFSVDRGNLLVLSTSKPWRVQKLARVQLSSSCLLIDEKYLETFQPCTLLGTRAFGVHLVLRAGGCAEMPNKAPCKVQYCTVPQGLVATGVALCYSQSNNHRGCSGTGRCVYF